MENTRTQKKAGTPFQTGLSLFLLGILVSIAATVLWMQSRYEPARWREQAGRPQPSRQPNAHEALPQGVEPLSPVERYDENSLSDKIDGKADLYMDAGFKALETRRFALAQDPSRWMERYVYDMGDRLNAFAVYSAQRRRDGRDIGIAPYAYLSSNGLFLVHGPYYLEIIASEASGTMQARVEALGQIFIKDHPVASGRIAELDLFAAGHLVPGSRKLIAHGAFGIQGMDRVFTAEYADGPARATAFIARRADAGQASASAEAFIAFWKEYGAEPVAPPDRLPAARIAFILDNYEVVVVTGPYLFGVHEASGLDFGLKVAERLQQTIAAAVR
jgi:hypothetical protein